MNKPLKFFAFALSLVFLFSNNMLPGQGLPVPPTATEGGCSLPATSAFSGAWNGATSIDFSWNAVSAAYAYRLELYYAGNLVASTSTGGTSATIGGLNNNLRYYAIIAPMCDESSVSSNVIGIEIINY
jgi:hypothetical protein